jgi:SAM-dependent methyltransferase
MLEKNLIKKCICENSIGFKSLIYNYISVLECNECGTMHQQMTNWDDNTYYNFYKKDYHQTYQKRKGAMNYTDRYTHDRSVAVKRLDAYKDILVPGSKGLDIGSSNSAFVHEAISRGFNCMGLDPGQDIGDDAVTIRGTLDTVNLESNSLDWITMHDSIEHMIDVNTSLEHAYNLLKTGGLLIVDLPDYFDPAGQHHWKYIEHLWFFSKDQLGNVLEKHNFKIETVLNPIPGKLIFYVRK